MRFVPSQTRRTANLARFVERSRAVDPAGAERMAALFASTDVIGQMAPPLAAHGLRINDLADAYAVWWINAWQATRGTNDPSDRATTLAVRDQARRALASIAEIRGASDAAKQEFSEALLIQAALIDSAVDQSKGNRAQLRAVAAAAAKGARAMGVDLSGMTLTDRGFVPIG